MLRSITNFTSLLLYSTITTESTLSWVNSTTTSNIAWLSFLNERIATFASTCFYDSVSTASNSTILGTVSAAITVFPSIYNTVTTLGAVCTTIRI